MIRVGVFGASGYMGGEALRVLLEHPEVDVAWATTRSGEPMEHFHRNLLGADVRWISPEEMTPCDAVFVAAPTGVAMELAPGLVASGTKVIDLGADFRLRSRADWERLYKREHTCWDLAQEAVYGVPELHRDEIRAARIVANPGCFSSATIFAVAPLLKADLIDRRSIVVDGLSGTAGAGAELHEAAHHPEIGNNIVPYNVIDHRHTYEMEQELGLLGGEVRIHFTPAYIPITRGILAICHCFPVTPVRRDELLDLYREFYDREPFVKVFDQPRESAATWQYRPYPWVAAVSGTNFCHVGLDVDERRGRIVVFSALDSIGKGGAHAGVQNLNILFGLEETAGLRRYGLHPY
ncbi:MAG: N-acetyl-gamma-glutamyl-phosphate reductase [Dehalococcoidia bacterium]